LTEVTVADPGKEETVLDDESAIEDMSIWAALATLARRSGATVVLPAFVADF
jgi:hypothetical protein